MNRAKAWQETVTFPTYGVGAPDRNPMFLEKRVYQGSSGAVYPFPVIDKIENQKHDQAWDTVFLENDYLKVMILPQLGGRVQMLLDKTNNYHCVYYQHVIKPALVGLVGPWISGGIEFNWPQHHRPTTYMPVDFRISENADGSATVWISEIDRMYGTKVLAGFTLHPDKAYLQIDARLYNRTPLPQTFLWWANPACHVDENHQSVFPPDVHAVMDHGKRDVSEFPIARGTYYKVNYAPGTDISRYKNIPVPTSYMAYHSDYNFVASYDHRRRAGLLHVANHHIAPGKKQWTWGHGDFGQAWDRQLTDSDGPYIELMCGVFTDNQPDFSWLNPYEEKSFTQYFMPYKQIGRIKNASTEAAIALEVEDGQAYLAAYVTSPRKHLRLELRSEGQVVFEKNLDLAPQQAFEATIAAPPEPLELRLLDENGREMLRYAPVKNTAPIPAPAEPALPPEKVATTEQLYLTALHLEQYRHATFDPEPYYREALRRDPTDVRNNNGLGLLLFRRGQFEQAEQYFRTAVATLTMRNPNPYDGEPSYNLGLSLRMQGRLDEAFDAFYKSVWNVAMRAQGYFQLAQIASIRGDFSQAVELCQQSLIGGWHNHKARHLKAALLRKLGRDDEAAAEDAITASIDPLYGQIREDESQDRIEIGLDFINAGLIDEGVELLVPTTGFQPMSAHAHGLEARGTYPMLLYLAGWAKGDPKLFEIASKQSPELCFPNRLEEMLALQAATHVNPEDGAAWYLLGNFLFSRKRYDEAIAAWEKAVALLPTYPTAYRNLALAYFNKKHDPQGAAAMLEKAFALDKTDARVLFELDQLYKKLNRSPRERLQLLERHPSLVEARDDLFIEHTTLLNLLGEHEIVQQRLANRQFHPWEGGEGKVTGNYVYSLLSLARKYLQHGQHEMALTAIDKARVYPHNLGEGKLPGAMENDLDYFAGIALEAMGRSDEAAMLFRRASEGLEEPVSAMFYNDQPPHMIFYQGLAQRRIGIESGALRRFQKLIDYGQKHLHDHVTIDYFAVSLPEFLVFEDDLDKRNEIHCRYMMALGYIGMGEIAAAQAQLEQVLSMDSSHAGAAFHRELLNSKLL
jgi:tetratricopeptide (TPR) repeat protein